MVQPPPPPADADAPAPLSDEEYESDQAGGDAELEEEEVSQETMDNDDGEECNGSSLLLQVVLLVRAHLRPLILSLNLKMTMMMVITMVMIKLLESRRGAKELVEGDHVHPLPRQPIVLPTALHATIIIYASNQHQLYHYLLIRMSHRPFVRLDELLAGH